LSGKYPFKIYRKPEFQSSSLIVAWNEDVGKLGSKAIDYLNQRLGGQEFAEIDPVEFFPLGGVQIEDDLAQFPESKFYACQENNLVTFKSNPPRFEWYKFLKSILDVAEHSCRAKEIYTIGGMVTLSAHTAPRELFAIANFPEMREVLSQYDLGIDMDYQAPRGQRPTLNSFLLWVAKKENIPGVCLWVPIPFYLIAMEDPRAWKKVLEFFDKRFDLKIDFSDLDQAIQDQDEKLTQARLRFPNIDEYIRRLESNIGLSEEENEKLVNEIEEFLRETSF